MSKGKLYEELLKLSDRVSDNQCETYDAVALDAINDLLVDVAKDLGLDHLWKKETLERMAKDGCYTISEKQSIELSLKLIKWFGEYDKKTKS